MSRPKLLDLFCCEGGASEGYRRAGFDVYGVDLFDKFTQRRYPFLSHKGDAILALFGAQAWPTPLTVVAVLSVPVALRAAEARGTMGVRGIGQSLLHVLVVMQVGTGAVLLNLPVQVMAALMALAFYTWGGAVDALDGGASGRAVAIEFGSLLLLGLVVGLLVHRP